MNEKKKQNNDEAEHISINVAGEKPQKLKKLLYDQDIIGIPIEIQAIEFYRIRKVRPYDPQPEYIITAINYQTKEKIYIQTYHFYTKQLIRLLKAEPRPIACRIIQKGEAKNKRYYLAPLESDESV